MFSECSLGGKVGCCVASRMMHRGSKGEKLGVGRVVVAAVKYFCRSGKGKSLFFLLQKGFSSVLQV